jgi:hypothetical protein
MQVQEWVPTCIAVGKDTYDALKTVEIGSFKR